MTGDPEVQDTMAHRAEDPEWIDPDMAAAIAKNTALIEADGGLATDIVGAGLNLSVS